MSRSACRTLVLMLLLGFSAGCSPDVRKPRLIGPGPAGVQRYNATQFDPYPQNDMGPEIVGGRPLDYQKPPDEVVRARQERERMRLWQTSPRY